MRPAVVDGEEVTVHQETTFEVWYEATDWSLTTHSDPESVRWPNGKPEAVTPDCADWMRDAGVDPETHDIAIATEEDWI